MRAANPEAPDVKCDQLRYTEGGGGTEEGRRLWLELVKGGCGVGCCVEEVACVLCCCIVLCCVVRLSGEEELVIAWSE